MLCVTLYTVGSVEYYEEKFSKKDVETSFIYMLNRLEELWANVKFSKLRKTCIRDRRLPSKLRKVLGSTRSLRKLTDRLSDSPFCNWLEIRILKSMADNADVPEATQLIETFEKCIYHRKCSEVKNHFKEQFINPDHLKKVTIKLNLCIESISVADLINYSRELESIFEQPCTLLSDNKTGCLEVCFCTLKSCHLRTKDVKRCLLKLRPYKVRYLQIGSSHKVYTTNLTETKQAKLLLAEVSLSLYNCKFSNIQ